MWIYWRVVGETVSWSVGYLDSGHRISVEGYDDQDEAREAVHYLNGGNGVS